MRNWDAQLSESPAEEPGSNDSFFSYAYPSASRPIASSSSSAISAPLTSALNPALSPCGWERDWESVQSVCDHVGIPRERVKLVDLSKEYWTKVFEPALRRWENGQTPNPDVACNRYGFLPSTEYALLAHRISGIDKSSSQLCPSISVCREGIGTIGRSSLLVSLPLLSDAIECNRLISAGHYARVARFPHAQRLCRGADHNKDQSYFLSSLAYNQVRKVSRPIRLRETSADKDCFRLAFRLVN